MKKTRFFCTVVLLEKIYNFLKHYPQHPPGRLCPVLECVSMAASPMVKSRSRRRMLWALLRTCRIEEDRAHTPTLCDDDWLRREFHFSLLVQGNDPDKRSAHQTVSSWTRHTCLSLKLMHQPWSFIVCPETVMKVRLGQQKSVGKIIGSWTKILQSRHTHEAVS